MTPDIDAVARLVEDIAAAEIMPRFARLRAEEVRDKGRGDLVTVADEGGGAGGGRPTRAGCAGLGRPRRSG